MPLVRRLDVKSKQPHLRGQADPKAGNISTHPRGWSTRRYFRNFTAAGNRTVEYYLFTPREEHAQTATRLPLVCFLHGIGDRIRPRSPFKSLKDDHAPWYVVCPQAPEATNWALGRYPRDGNKGLPRAWVHVAPHVLLMSLIDHLAASLPIDRHRVALVGASMGAYATFDLLGRFPGRIAVAVPIAGGGDPLLAPNMASVSVWVWHGRQDVKVPLNASRQMVAAVARARGASLQHVALGTGEVDSQTIEQRSADDRLRWTELPSGHMSTINWVLSQPRLVDWVQLRLRAQVAEDVVVSGRTCIFAPPVCRLSKDATPCLLLAQSACDA